MTNVSYSVVMNISADHKTATSISRFIRTNGIGFQKSLRKVKHKAGSPSHRLVLYLNQSEIKTVGNYIKLKNDPSLTYHMDIADVFTN